MPCPPPAHASDFDFWIGGWELTWPRDEPGAADGSHVAHGRNVISRVMDDRVGLEQFDRREGLA